MHSEVFYKESKKTPEVSHNFWMSVYSKPRSPLNCLGKSVCPK